jgi:cell division protease FtsH
MPMPPLISPEQLPESLSHLQAVAQAYPTQLTDLAAALGRRLSCLVRCPKELALPLVVNLRDRLNTCGFAFSMVNGRPAANETPGLLTTPGTLGRMIEHLRTLVRGPLEKRVVALPHLDLMTSNPAGLTGDAREVVGLLHEYPDLLWVGFHDPALPLPRILTELPLFRLNFEGVSLERLPHLITRAEGRKFGSALDLGALHRRVSGVNALRLRRLLSTLDRQDLPADPHNTLAEVRRFTLAGGLTVPEERLVDVSGYEGVKEQLRAEFLTVPDRLDAAEAGGEREWLERMLPRGLILAGPSGVGKRLLARALAGELGAALLATSGVDLKSRYVGGSEENLRHLFARAREAAPALILFHEPDSFAGPPERNTGAVEPSMLLQLIEEMEGLRRDELVVVVGTTTDRHRLHHGLFRPGRFEIVIEVEPPLPEDRRAILGRLDEQLGLRLAPEALNCAVELTESSSGRPPYHGERLHALCRAIARRRLRDGADGPTTPADVEHALTTL